MNPQFDETDPKDSNMQSVATGGLNRTFLVRIVVALVLVTAAISIYLVVSGRLIRVVAAKKEVRLGISKSFLSIPVYIAQARRCFADEGLDVTVIEYTSGKVAMKNMFAGEVEIVTVADMPIVFDSFVRDDFRIVSTFTASYSFVNIVARKDRGIERATDLRGKKVGVNVGTSSHFFLWVFLIYSGLSMADIEMVPLKTVDMPNALEEGTVDAISVWDPYTQQTLELLGDRAKLLPSREIYRTTFNFAVLASYTQDHIETIEMFLKAIDRATEYLRDHKEDSHAIIADVFDMDEEHVHTFSDNYIFRISLDQVLLTSWDDIARWAMENQLVDGKNLPNYLDYVWIDALDDVKAEAISIIR